VRTETHGNTLQHAASRCRILQHAVATDERNDLVTGSVAHRNAQQHTAARCNALQHTATRYDTLTATHCNTLQYAATHSKNG